VSQQNRRQDVDAGLGARPPRICCYEYQAAIHFGPVEARMQRTIPASADAHHSGQSGVGRLYDGDAGKSGIFPLPTQRRSSIVEVGDVGRIGCGPDGIRRRPPARVIPSSMFTYAQGSGSTAVDGGCTSCKLSVHVACRRIDFNPIKL